MLMDLEKKEVVDLLPVRSVASLRSWLEHHPRVEATLRLDHREGPFIRSQLDRFDEDPDRRSRRDTAAA
jgi:hypothetical protein